jgi:hypothetical protein
VATCWYVTSKASRKLNKDGTYTQFCVTHHLNVYSVLSNAEWAEKEFRDKWTNIRQGLTSFESTMDNNNNNNKVKCTQLVRLPHTGLLSTGQPRAYDSVVVTFTAPFPIEAME